MIRRSTTRPYGKWYDSGRHMIFGFRGFTDAELDSVRVEMEQDEQERVRAADMMADYCLERNWREFDVALNPPIDGCTVWDFISRRVVVSTDIARILLRTFWREKV